MKLPLITAHSGCEQTPLDSMESVERAISLVADVVEMDVRRADDGTLYVSHDRQSGDNALEKVTLESVFRRIQNTELRLNCDIKEPFALCSTLDMAGRFGFGSDRLILTGAVSPEQLAMEPTITERASVYLNMEQALKFLYMGKMCAEQTEARFPELMNNAKPFVTDLLQNESSVMSLIRLMKALHVQGINMPHKNLSSSLAEIFRAENILCSVWTVNEMVDIDRCLHLNVYNIATLAVRSAIEHREAHRLKSRPSVKNHA